MRQQQAMADEGQVLVGDKGLREAGVPGDQHLGEGGMKRDGMK